MTPAAVFDRVAAEYDATWTRTPVGRAQRGQVWRVLEAMFQRGDRVIDIGCGTGEDALYLMARGVFVQAVDASPVMVSIAQSRGVVAEVRRAEDLDVLGGMFDGAVSNFGALNCVADLGAVAASIGRAVRPGGQVAICLIGRFCLWESLYYALRLNFRKALRRRRASDFRGMTVYYPSATDVRAAFAPHFECRRWTGIGLLVPPSYVQIPPALVGALAACDRLLAGLPVLRGLADHRLFVLVRK